MIGQAVKDLGTEQILASHSQIPWKQIAGARNILAHHYLGVDIALI
ncbi:MAG: HepT-like ribonuclease domain-containing protein [Gammaproteobacteria bacterium]